ncbi:hypothetical protein EIL87_01790 [Saccharopolyspora rhizosphaerae]|uniref:Uncharacterized protein n=1 Tax=Saccharopolyspora rhizosphaerae TaxID=2492662 RepID=A0A426K5G3_9PSEU|nr:hypothetical protein [Saccharopolyspora rhizosphaerae]RRO20628.1 hypothetical protein EIL87_01790 [Saccharopolyspora rhizosphaerae]
MTSAGAFTGALLRLVAAGAPVAAVVSWCDSDALGNAGLSPTTRTSTGTYLRRNGLADAETSQWWCRQ